jgi:hypothetical protein
MLGQLKALVLALRQRVLPKSLAGRASEYALGQWTRLERCFEHGDVEVDNNSAERSIRPIALGRKNWLHFGSKQAGPNIAAILSLIETCHRLQIPARAYLLDVLPRLANGTRSTVAELTPTRWLANQAA